MPSLPIIEELTFIDLADGKLKTAKIKDTTYSSKQAASGGTDVSLVTTGEKYTWNNKSNLALGETSATAYRGDRGKAAYDHATAKGSAFTNGLYKFATNAEGHVTGATAVAKSDITGLGIPAQDTTYEVAKKGATGLCPALPNETSTNKFLRQDATWGDPLPPVISETELDTICT